MFTIWWITIRAANQGLPRGAGLQFSIGPRSQLQAIGKPFQANWPTPKNRERTSELLGCETFDAGKCWKFLGQLKDGLPYFMLVLLAQAQASITLQLLVAKFWHWHHPFLGEVPVEVGSPPHSANDVLQARVWLHANLCVTTTKANPMPFGTIFSCKFIT